MNERPITSCGCTLNFDCATCVEHFHQLQRADQIEQRFIALEINMPSITVRDQQRRFCRILGVVDGR
jgi:hypothetical protein